MERRTGFAGKASRVDWSWRGGTPQESSSDTVTISFLPSTRIYVLRFSRKLFKLFSEVGKISCSNMICYFYKVGGKIKKRKVSRDRLVSSMAVDV